jgi:protein TonB
MANILEHSRGRPGSANRCRWLAVLLAAALLGACASGGNRPLQLLSGSGPIYPEAAKSAGIEGEVTVQYDITTTGDVTNARVLNADPPDVFDAAALAAVQSWKYRPLQIDGVVREATAVTSTVRFRLGAGDEYRDYDE